MADYRRAHAPGGTFFFTVVTEGRAPIFESEFARKLLGEVMRECAVTRPFETDGIILLNDHLHSIWTLPPGDTDYSIRWSFIKANFTRRWLESGGTEETKTGSRVHTRRRGVWQRRFWEHQITGERDLHEHLNYLHYNPVKHGYVACPHMWPHSSFAKWVRNRSYEQDWLCTCDGKIIQVPKFNVNLRAIECDL
jgi:putative transposase